jgi:ArsR family transcriptional regulator
VKELTVLQCCVPLAKPTISDQAAENLEVVFQALADRHRVKMLNILLSSDDEVCVCDFEELLGLKQSRTSYHLRQLVDAGLIARERRGTYSYYRLVPGALDEVGTLLASRSRVRRAPAATTR